jgi:predicted transcriptional regulator
MTVPNHSVRLDPELFERIDQLVEAMRKRAGGSTRITRSDAIRLVVNRGLPVAEKEMKAAK